MLSEDMRALGCSKLACISENGHLYTGNIATRRCEISNEAPIQEARHSKTAVVDDALLAPIMDTPVLAWGVSPPSCATYLKSCHFLFKSNRRSDQVRHLLEDHDKVRRLPMSRILDEG